MSKELYREAEAKWGENAQLGMVQEECSELIEELSNLIALCNDTIKSCSRLTKGVNKFDRGKMEPEKLLEEAADVRIMTEQIVSMMSKYEPQAEELFQQFYNGKLERLKARLHK